MVVYGRVTSNKHPSTNRWVLKAQRGPDRETAQSARDLLDESHWEGIVYKDLPGHVA